MKEIIKYQLKDRKGFMLLILSVFGALNLIAFAIELYAAATGANLESFDSMLWVVVAVATTFITTVVMFFLCASGHVAGLVYRDTSYLMLTIPRAGWQIIGGRFVAGLAEFAVYVGSGILLAFVHAIIISFTGSVRPESVFKLVAAILDLVLVVNLPAFVQIVLLALLVYALVGTTITFAVVASRSFLKSRKLATVAAIAFFFVVTRWSTQFAQWLSDRFDWYWTITVKVDPNRWDALSDGYGGIGHVATQYLHVPIAQVAFGALLAVALFYGASWLLEKKVEL